MSKETSEYRIIDYAAIAAELERVALEQAWASARMAEAEMQQAEAAARNAAKQLGISGFEAPTVPRAPSRDLARRAVEAYLAALRVRTAHLYDKIKMASAAVEAGRMMAEAARRDASVPLIVPEAKALRRKAAGLIKSEMRRLADHPVTDAELRLCRTTAERLLAVPEGHHGEYSNLELLLRRQVHDAIGAVKRRAADAREATDLVDSLRGLDPAACADVLRLLGEVVAGGRQMSAEIRQATKDAAARARTQVEDLYVERVLRDALEEIGYAVDEDPHRPPGSTGTTVYRSPTLSHVHRLEVRADPAARAIHTQVIRLRPAAAGDVEVLLADADAEAEGCLALARVRDIVARHGIALDLSARQTPVAEHAAGVTAPIAARRTSRVPTPQGEAQERPAIARRRVR